MKQLTTLILFFTFCCFSIAQNNLPPERIVTIANLADNNAVMIDYDLSLLAIESKISRSLSIDKQIINLVNPTLLNEGGKGWFLQYEFSTTTYAGLYKEELRIKNGKLVITESRDARMAIATNCNTLQFTYDEEHCKCTNKKNDSEPSDVTFRLFFSSN